MGGLTSTNARAAARVFAAAVAVALVAGCTAQSQSPVEPPSGDPADHAASGDDPAAGGVEAPTARDHTVLGEDTPLGAYREYMRGPAYDFGQHMQRVVEASDQREALIASCMKDAGFEYRPAPYAGPKEPQPDYISRATYLLVPPLDSDRAAVAKWGYGLDPTDGPSGPFVGLDPEVEKVMAQNDAYVKSLSAAAQEQYWTAFSGPTDKDGRPLPNGGGCAAAASEQVPEVGALPDTTASFDAAHGDLIEAMVELTKWEVGMDPRTLALDQEWEQCATAKGLDFSGQAFWFEGGGQADASMYNHPSPVHALDIARSLDADGQPPDPDYQPVEGEDPEFGYLRAYPAQIDVALADFDCRQQVGYMDRIMAIQHDLERQFIDQNHDRLEAM
ncbi:MAG: hypothetical protein LBK95_12680, partial [Bifidobacteriaceae bacterium]|nr:hypothetical protein [Bifidobacteriaceae bacterium]